MTVESIERMSDAEIAALPGGYSIGWFLMAQSRIAFEHEDDAFQDRCDAQLDRIHRIHV